MGRILGIDVGDRRTGVALSDPLGVTSSPLAVIEETDRRRLRSEVLRLATVHEVTAMVVGIPRPLQGGSSSQSLKSHEVAAMLAKASALPVMLWDERFTTKLARELKGGGGHADAVAAAFMLQNYLDAKAGEV